MRLVAVYLTLCMLCFSYAVFPHSTVDETLTVPYVLVPYRIKDKWGFSDQKGNLKIQPVYEKVHDMQYYYIDGKYKNLMVVTKNGELLVINHLNQVVVSGIKGFDKFSLNASNYETVIVGRQNKKGVYFNGKEIIPCIYDEIETLANLTFRITTGEMKGLH